MSTYITDRIVAIRLRVEETGLTRDHFIVAELGGDNNVRSVPSGKRSRHWSATAIGEEWEVIGKAAWSSSSCSGGMLKLRGRQTTPETYIRAYRKALKEAMIGFIQARDLGFSVAARIRVAEKDWTGFTYTDLAKTYLPIVGEYYGEKYRTFHFDLNNPREVQDWLSHSCGSAWNSCEFYGPGTC